MTLSDAFRHLAEILALGVAKWRQSGQQFGLAGATAILIGCAGPGLMGGGYLTADSAVDAKVSVVKDRAGARWKALIAGNIDEAYGYLSPASREVTTLEQFKAKTRTGSFRAVTIDAVQCEAEICKVKLSLTYDHRMMQGITTPLEETWVLDKGQFWYVYRG